MKSYGMCCHSTEPLQMEGKSRDFPSSLASSCHFWLISDADTHLLLDMGLGAHSRAALSKRVNECLNMQCRLDRTLHAVYCNKTRGILYPENYSSIQLQFSCTWATDRVLRLYPLPFNLYRMIRYQQVNIDTYKE